MRRQECYTESIERREVKRALFSRYGGNSGDHSPLWHTNSDVCGLAEIIEREESLVARPDLNRRKYFPKAMTTVTLRPLS